jgi:hypothetical protein
MCFSVLEDGDREGTGFGMDGLLSRGELFQESRDIDSNPDFLVTIVSLGGSTQDKIHRRYRSEDTGQPKHGGLGKLE